MLVFRRMACRLRGPSREESLFPTQPAKTWHRPTLVDFKEKRPTNPSFPFATLSPEEAGRYLETYKAYEQKPADLLKEKVDQDYLSRVRAFLLCSSTHK